jgi:DNA-binding LacI/PurR family transcriptional regulator
MAEMLLRHIDASDPTVEHTILPIELIVRESTAAPSSVE